MCVWNCNNQNVNKRIREQKSARARVRCEIQVQAPALNARAASNLVGWCARMQFHYLDQTKCRMHLNFFLLLLRRSFVLVSVRWLRQGTLYRTCVHVHSEHMQGTVNIVACCWLVNEACWICKLGNRTDFQFIIRLLIFHKWKNKYVIVKNALKAQFESLWRQN